MARIVAVRVDAAMYTAAILVLAFIEINTDFSVAIVSIFTFTAMRFSCVKAKSIFMALILSSWLTSIYIVSIQCDDGPAEPGSGPEVPRHDPVEPGVDGVVDRTVRGVLTAERVEELGLDVLFLVPYVPLYSLITDLHVNFLVLLADDIVGYL